MSAAADLFSARAVRLVTGASIDLGVNGGEILCISGPSGSGKTRLLRALADLDEAPGDVRLRGRAREAFQPCQWRGQVMLAPAQPRWWLDTAARHFCRPMEREAGLLRLDPERLQAPVDQLSTGEQARAGLLRALSRDPSVLLLDEPTGALDAASAEAAEALLLDWLEPQRAIVWISHDESQIARVAGRHQRLDGRGLTAA